MKFRRGEDGDKWLDDDRAASLTPGALGAATLLTQPPPRAPFFPEKKLSSQSRLLQSRFSVQGGPPTQFTGDRLRAFY